MAIMDNYKPTPAQRKLLEALTNPENFKLNDTELCQVANVSRETLRKARDNPCFMKYYNSLVFKALGTKIGNLLNATYKYALTPSGHQDRKMLLTMLGMYSDKQETTIKGEMSVNNPFEGLTTEELRKLAK